MRRLLLMRQVMPAIGSYAQQLILNSTFFPSLALARMPLKYYDRWWTKPRLNAPHEISCLRWKLGVLARQPDLKLLRDSPKSLIVLGHRHGTIVFVPLSHILLGSQFQAQG